MKEHAVNQLDNFIMGFYMEDTSICDEIINYYNEYPEKYSGKVGHKETDTLSKESTECPIWQDSELFKKYANGVLQDQLNLYIQKYEFVNRMAPWTITTGVNVQHYTPNQGFYAWHCERARALNPIVSRHMVFITYLNDVTDCGETEFYYQKIKIKPEKGLTIFFPVDWTFTHRGITSPTQHKYIATGWYNMLPTQQEISAGLV